MPEWLHVPSWIWLSLGLGCAGISVLHLIAGHRQHMWIMDVVWPVTALFGTFLALYAYFSVGRLSTRAVVQQAKNRSAEPPNRRKPFWQSVGIGATHCGSGCALGDILAEWLVFGAGWALADVPMFAAWVVDYIFAFMLGIVFQYFTIKPMRNLSVKDGIKQALKADSASLTAWQIGMYG